MGTAEVGHLKRTTIVRAGVYATAMAVCCLEVYYRHLPIFRKFEVR